MDRGRQGFGQRHAWRGLAAMPFTITYAPLRLGSVPDLRADDRAGSPARWHTGGETGSAHEAEVEGGAPSEHSGVPAEGVVGQPSDLGGEPRAAEAPRTEGAPAAAQLETRTAPTFAVAPAPAPASEVAASPGSGPRAGAAMTSSPARRRRRIQPQLISGPSSVPRAGTPSAADAPGPVEQQEEQQAASAAQETETREVSFPLEAAAATPAGDEPTAAVQPFAELSSSDEERRQVKLEEEAAKRAAEEQEEGEEESDEVVYLSPEEYAALVAHRRERMAMRQSQQAAASPTPSQASTVVEMDLLPAFLEASRAASAARPGGAQHGADDDDGGMIDDGGAGTGGAASGAGAADRSQRSALSEPLLAPAHGEHLVPGAPAAVAVPSSREPADDGDEDWTTTLFKLTDALYTDPPTLDLPSDSPATNVAVGSGLRITSQDERVRSHLGQAQRARVDASTRGRRSAFEVIAFGDNSIVSGAESVLRAGSGGACLDIVPIWYGGTWLDAVSKLDSEELVEIDKDPIKMTAEKQIQAEQAAEEEMRKELVRRVQRVLIHSAVSGVDSSVLKALPPVLVDPARRARQRHGQLMLESEQQLRVPGAEAGADAVLAVLEKETMDTAEKVVADAAQQDYQRFRYDINVVAAPEQMIAVESQVRSVLTRLLSPGAWPGAVFDTKELREIARRVRLDADTSADKVRLKGLMEGLIEDLRDKLVSVEQLRHVPRLQREASNRVRVLQQRLNELGGAAPSLAPAVRALKGVQSWLAFWRRELQELARELQHVGAVEKRLRLAPHSRTMHALDLEYVEELMELRLRVQEALDLFGALTVEGVAADQDRLRRMASGLQDVRGVDVGVLQRAISALLSKASKSTVEDAQESARILLADIERQSVEASRRIDEARAKEMKPGTARVEFIDPKLQLNIELLGSLTQQNIVQILEMPSSDECQRKADEVINNVKVQEQFLSTKSGQLVRVLSVQDASRVLDVRGVRGALNQKAGILLASDDPASEQLRKLPEGSDEFYIAVAKRYREAYVDVLRFLEEIRNDCAPKE